MPTPDNDEMRKRAFTDPRYISIKRFNYNIVNLESRYDETPNHIIAQALLMSEQEVEDVLKKVVPKLRNLMGIEL